jgi:hypothetical protein
VLPLPVAREPSQGGAAAPYVRHRPERTLLDQLVEEYYPSFKAHLVAQGETLVLRGFSGRDGKEPETIH